VQCGNLGGYYATTSLRHYATTSPEAQRPSATVTRPLWLPSWREAPPWLPSQRGVSPAASGGRGGKRGDPRWIASDRPPSPGPARPGPAPLAASGGWGGVAFGAPGGWHLPESSGQRRRRRARLRLSQVGDAGGGDPPPSPEAAQEAGQGGQRPHRSRKSTNPQPRRDPAPARAGDRQQPRRLHQSNLARPRRRCRP
jgi:hypothetical protein